MGIEDSTGTQGVNLRRRTTWPAPGHLTNDLWCPTDNSAVSFFGASPTYGAVSGQVTLDGGAERVTDVLVSANGVSHPSVHPNASGQYTMVSVQTGVRHFWASLAGYHLADRHDTIRAEGATGLNLTLAARSATGVQLDET